jgi:ketosteroid isomerase-like protein
MTEESTTSDLVELTRASFEAANRRDLDAAMSFYAPDATWEAMDMGTSFEGVAAIRGLYEDWIGAYEQYEIEPEEILDLGNGVIFAVNCQTGRPVGSTGDLRLRQGTVATWVEGMIVRITNFGDIDEARAAAERLAQERG